MPLPGLAVTACAAALLLSSCASGDSNPGIGAPEPKPPFCEDLVAVGKPVLESTFNDGCDMSDGSEWNISRYECGNRGIVIVFKDAFYGSFGGTWESQDVKRVIAECQSAGGPSVTVE